MSVVASPLRAHVRGRLASPALLLREPLDTALTDAFSVETSYRMVGQLPSALGGRLNLMRREEGVEDWYNYVPDRFDYSDDQFRGHPGWARTLLGRPLAAALGMVEIDARHVTTPTASGADAALDALDDLSQDPALRTSLRFYPTPLDAPRVPDGVYARAFAFEGRLPIATHTMEAAHDVHFHLAGTFLPPEAVAYLRAVGRAFYAALDALERAGVLGAEEGRAAASRAETAYAEAVDHVTGAPMVGFNPDMPLDISMRGKVPCSFLHWFAPHYAEGRTAGAHARALLAELEGSSPAAAAALATWAASATDPDVTLTPPDAALSRDRTRARIDALGALVTPSTASV